MADPRKLKDEAAEAGTKARYRRAAELYEQIARLEPGDPQWSHRAGESWKRVGDRLDIFGEVLAALHGAAARDDDLGGGELGTFRLRQLLADER